MEAIKDSVIFNGDHCYICGSRAHHKHHSLHGTANRKLAEKYKLYVPLCHVCHERVHSSKDRGLDKALMSDAEFCFEIAYPDLDFLKIFGKHFKY